jgi:hypothetical protein
MTPVHSRTEIADLRSSWEQLLCTDRAEPETAMGSRTPRVDSDAFETIEPRG